MTPTEANHKIHLRAIYALARMAVAAVCLVCNPWTALAEFPSSFSTRYITIDNGLNRNYIDDIHRDRNGFVWLAMGGGGLVRYDGHSMLTFSEAIPERSIPCDFVKKVAEDSHNRLWAATSNGLFVVNLKTMSVLQLEDIHPYLRQFEGRSIASVCADEAGNVWIGSNGVIICLCFNQEGSVASKGELDTHGSHTPFVFNEINHKIWTSFNGKIYELTPAVDNNSTIIRATELKTAIPHGCIVNKIIEKGEDAWIATSNGLVRYNIATQVSKLYTCAEMQDNSLSQNFVSDLAIAPDNRLIASTLCGYNIYNAITDDFTRVNEQDYGLNSPFINCLLVDGQNVWIGTETGGVNILTPKAINCDFYPTSHPVNAIYSDPMGGLWVGCVEGGLWELDHKSGSLSKVADASNSLPHNSVSAITMDSSGRLWVGTWGGGLALLDSRNPRHSGTHFEVLAGMERPYIGSIIYDNINDGVWIGANPGIFYYDCKSGRTICPIANSVDLAFGPVGAVIDNDGHLWMGCNNGLYDIDLHSRKGDKWNFRLIDHILGSDREKTKESVNFLAIGPDGSLLIGSDSHGLYKRTTEGGAERFTHYTTAQGLAHNAVKGIAFDGKTIWVSTSKGLSSLSPINSNIDTYFKENGLPDDSFYWNAATASHGSDVYFGTMTGLMSVKSENTRPSSVRPVIFTSLTVDNNADVSPYVDSDISVTDKVSLHERNRSFAVTFSAMDFSAAPTCKYLYMLKGFDDNWISLPEGRNDASYTNIPPGHYTLRVKYGPNGIESALPIIVRPYFYNTYWFFFIVLLAIATLTWLAWRMRVQSILRQKTELAIKVDERTREISAQKQRIEEQARQVQQFTVERLSFFTNLTHEFRTPITLVLGPLEHAMKLTDNPKTLDLLHMAFRNAQYLMSLVNQLMDFRKLESGKMEIHRDKGDFRTFVEEVAQQFSLVLDKRGIKLVTYFHLPNNEICFDKEAMRKLLHNFLSNASKYTPDGGTISIYAAELRSVDGQRKLYLSVKDTGEGIDEADIDKVFDKFYQGKSPMKYPSPMGSSGLGLHLCKSIVEAYGGTLRAKNNHGRGCSFRMLLPLGDDIPAQKPTQSQPIEPQEEAMPTILIVEDNPDMRAYLRGMLSGKYRVLEATDGEEALEAIKDPDIDFVISDIMMPRMDGLTFVGKMKENFETSHIPVLMLTAKTAQASELESFRLGVDGYLTKPFSEEMLLARIEAILANRRRRANRLLSTLGHSENDQLPPAEPEAFDDSPDARFITQVMDTIEANYRNSYYEVGDFADALGVSRTVLNKKLQSLLGKSANKLIRDYRLNVALQLIKDNRKDHSMNISEIAYDVGFNDSKYFTRCFTKRYGVPPNSVMQGVDPEIQAE